MPSADVWGCVSYGNFEMRWVYFHLPVDGNSEIKRKLF